MAPASVLSGSASVSQVWLGSQNNGSLESGALTVQSGATLSTSGGFIVSENSTLVSSGAISVGDGNGMIVRDAGNVTLNSGATLNKITLGENSTATFNAGSTVTTIQNLSNNAQLTMNNTYSSNLFMNQDSSLTVNGTLNGNFGINSTAMQYVGEAGTVTGEIELNGSDQMTVAGNVTGRFSLNQTSQAFIEATANILSDSGNSWIYNTAAVTWNVGADGSIGTLKTSRLEQNAGQFDGEWRYDSSAADMVVDLSAYEADGSSISLQLVSGIQNESAFASNVTFLRNGSDITSDFSYDGTGTFSGVVVPEPGTYALLAGCFALASVMIRRRR
jgi:cytoskeletal protein CcmA (bactofilin family)